MPEETHQVHGEEFPGFFEIEQEVQVLKQFKIIVEKCPDGYVAYPLGMKGAVVGEGDTYEEALTDVKSAIKFHIETFGKDVLEPDPPVLEAFVAEAGIAI
jgi:predicted RNase H-like HicB family nuclease